MSALVLVGLSLVRSISAQSQIIKTPGIANGHWIDTWTSMPQLTEFTNLPPPPYNGTNVVFQNSTIRQTLHMSTGADQIRIRVSNAFGLNDLPIDAMTIALPFNGSSGVSAIQPQTLQTVTFDGQPSFIIPSAGLVVSDPLNFTIAPLSTITVTMYLAAGQQSNFITSHPGSRSTTWFTMGNQVSATNLTGPLLNNTAHWYFLSAVEAWSPPDYRSFAIIGDSITDGRGSDTDRNNRWPDQVLNKMQSNPTTNDIAVINQAAGGNRILYDGLGPNALSRLDRDVLSHTGVRYAMIFEGVNDIGVADATPANQTLTSNRLIAAYNQIITRCHAFNIPIFAATITPFQGPNTTIQAYTSPLREQTRQTVNSWIRSSGRFDAVLDFDAWLADPANPAQLNPDFNSGDFLHPNVAGYARIAEMWPLDLFERFKDGPLVGSFF